MQSIQCFANQIAGQANLHKLKENLQELPKRWLSRQEQQPSEEYLLGTVTGDCNYHFTFRLEGGGLFQTGVLVASAENGPGGVPVPLKCRWRRRMGDGTAVDIPGVTSNMYQISADDVGTHICVEAEPADAEDGMVGRVHGEIGPFELDPATRRNLDNALGQGGARFNVSQPQALGDASPAASKRQELAIHVSVDTVRVVPLQGGSERPAREMVVEYTPDLPKLIIHPLDTTKFQLILGEGRHFHLVAPSRTSRDMIVLTMRCFHARRQVSTQTILQQLLPVLPVDRSGGGVPTYGGALVPTNTDSKLDACIWLERVTKELNRAMQQKEISEKILRNTNSEKRQLQAQLVETISGFTEVIEGIQEQFGCETGLGMQTPTTSVELLQEQLREANAQNKVLQAETHSERAQLEKLIQANKAAPAAEAAAGNVQGLREEKQLLQMRLKELSVSSSHQTRDQADQVHAHELKRLRQDIEMLHNQKELLRKTLQDADRERQELQDNFLYVKGQLDKAQMKQAHAAADVPEVNRHRQTLQAMTEERNRIAMRLESILRDVEKEKTYHEQSLERVMSANGKLMEERDRVAKEVQQLSQLYAESVQQLQGRADALSNTSGVFRADSLQNTMSSVADPAEFAKVRSQLAQVEDVLSQKDQENEALKSRIRKLAVS